MIGHSGTGKQSCAEVDDAVSGKVYRDFSAGTREGLLDLVVDGRDWLGSMSVSDVRLNV